MAGGAETSNIAATRAVVRVAAVWTWEDTDVRYSSHRATFKVYASTPSSQVPLLSPSESTASSANKSARYLS